MRTEASLYIPGLNGIRAIAALIVLFCHIDQFSYKFGSSNIGFWTFGMAAHGVTIFFTLSGFLITYLLLLERQKGIIISNFYIRRILRIWPLYFLLIILTILLLWIFPELRPEAHLGSSLLMYLLFVPNLAFVMDYTIMTITPLWSVGVEEQFYLFWPILIKFFSNIFIALVTICIFYVIIKLCAYYSGINLFYSFVIETRIDCMAIGGFGAYLIHDEKKAILNVLFSKIFQILAWLVLLFSIIVKPLNIHTFINNEMYSFLALIIIINVGFNKNSIIKLENYFFNFIGRISYGIYCYHMLVIALLFLFKNKYLSNFNLNATITYLIIIIHTIFISHLSYRYFESYFIKKKWNFAVVKTTDDNPAVHKN